MPRRIDALNRRNRIISVAVIVGAVVLLIILLAVLIPRHKKDEPNVTTDPNVITDPDVTTEPNVIKGPDDRIECPGFKDAAECASRGCKYDNAGRGPACYMDKERFSFKVENADTKPLFRMGEMTNLTADTPYGPSLATVAYQVIYITENIVRVRLLDPKHARYEVPVKDHFNPSFPHPDPANLAYEVMTPNVDDVFNFKIKRKSDNTILWDTSIGGLVMSNQFLQIASYLPSRNIYGLGENNHPTLRHDLEYKTWPMFARDRFPEPDVGPINLYGVHPFYTCLENTTKSHGVLFLNSNAMEVTLLPKPAISFRTIGGIIDLMFFVGDNPEHVVQLYTSVVGRPMLPPYWGLGFQLSRYGYNSLANVKNAIDRTRRAGIAQDVQFLDIDHMDQNRDFTYNKKEFAGLIDYIKYTKTEYGLKWIIIIDPAIEAMNDYSVYETGLQEDVYVKRSPDWDPTMFPENLRDNKVAYGKVWPSGPAAFPDFLNPKTKSWWINTIKNYHKELPFDGLWIDMNEPSNFETNEDTGAWTLKCPKSDQEFPPYNPLKASGSDRLSKTTICMDSQQSDEHFTYSHYDVHSLYGWSQTEPTLRAAESATGARSLVISRSTYPSSGRHTGHWLGDNKSTWEDLRRSIIGMLEFNLFGIPYIGADICGFFDDTTDELCKRWMQLGAFYPFFRNHNGIGTKDQDPGALGGDVAKASKLAVERRYKLQPYLYSLFHRAHIDGSTVVRPLFHEFPEDENTWDNSQQFMWGRCLLVSPVLNEGATSLKMYLPKGEWWKFDFQASAKEPLNGTYIVKTNVSDMIPVHARGGCIIPGEAYRMTDPPKPDANRTYDIYFFLQDGKAEGEIYIDKGYNLNPIESKTYDLIQFSYHDNTIEVNQVFKGQKSGVEYEMKLHVFGDKWGVQSSRGNNAARSSAQPIIRTVKLNPSSPSVTIIPIHPEDEFSGDHGDQDSAEAIELW